MKSIKSSKPSFQAPFGLLIGHSVLIVVLLGILGTSFAFFFATLVINRDEERRFEMSRQDVENLVTARVDRFVNLLRHTRAFLSTKERLSREDFHLFFQNVDIRRSYVGLQGVAFVERVPRRNISAHEREVREDGFRHYQVWPKPHRPVVYPVKYLEPMDERNQRALGFDMLKEESRRTAMHSARDTGKPVLSSRVRLLQENGEDEQPGFLLFLPVYKRGWKTNTVENRKQALFGLVSCPFRARDFFEEITKSDPLFKEGLAMEAYDGPHPTPENLLFSSSSFSPKKSAHQAQTRLAIAGHEWTIHLYNTPGFGSRADRYAPFFVLLCGLLVTVLVTWVVYVTGKQADLQRERAAAEQLARENLESLAEDLSQAVKERDLSLQRQEEMLRVGQVVSAELDVNNVVQAITDAATKLSGARIGAFFYNVINQNGESFVLYALSGAPREQFESFPMPRNTAVFRPIFSGESPVRSDDITQDPLFGKNKPYFGFPKGHFPVKSYLAVSVVSRSGEVLGGIFLGHHEKGIFGAREEEVVKGLAAQAAIAIDNARLFQKTLDAVETRDEFLSICSHELRTPLTSLKLQNQLVQRSLAQPPEPSAARARFSKLIQQSGTQIDRLVRLVEEMLDISRIRSGKLTIAPEQVDLTALARETLERFDAQLQSMRCRAELVAPSELVGTWDKLRIEQVLVNLLTNAMKYGQGKPIRMELKVEDDRAVITVQDHGIGIAKENQARIFERFERAVSKSEISGLGLGLYIVKQIIELHQGTIRVESEPGKGSLFIVVLPLHFQPLSSPGPGAPVPRPQAAEPPSPSLVF